MAGMRLRIVMAALLLGSAAAVTAQRTTAPDHAAEIVDDISRSIDLDRLLRERSYAEQFLQAYDRNPPDARGDAALEQALAATRLLALAGAGRADEARSAIDALIARPLAHPRLYFFAWFAAWKIEDDERGVAIFESAARHLPVASRAEFHRTFEPEIVFSFYHGLRERNRTELRRRLAEAAVTLGWPGEGHEDSRDALRLQVLDNRLEQGDRESARALAAAIETPTAVLQLILEHKYDGLLQPAPAPLDRLRQALAAQDRRTAAAVAAAPDDLEAALRRGQYLRSVGRYEDALAVLLPHTRDLHASFARAEHGMWIANEAAYALLDLGRNDEAVALMERLAAEDIEQRPGLIGPLINRVEVLRSAGRSAEALAYARQLEAGFASRYANDYGKMWVASGAACALASLGRPAEAAPYVEQLVAHSDVNPAALTGAYLCLDDLDSAEAVVLRRLGSDESFAVVQAMQDYEITSVADRDDPIYARLIALRSRPAVAAALNRVARVMRLPLARTYWGGI